MTRRQWLALPVAWLALMLSAPAGSAEGTLGCEQLYALAQSAVELRDQGYSLQQVLAGLAGKEVESKLSSSAVQVLRKAVTAVYLGNASAEEVALVCKQTQPER